MRPAEAYTTREARLPDDLPAICDIRRMVFIEEQQIPANLEWDGLDADCRHVLAFSQSDEAVGTGRLLANGRIGRMAVLPDWRGRGIGTAILDALLQLARREDHPRVSLHAQRTVARFYRNAGFRETGEVFMEAGIEHVPMEKNLSVINN